MAWRTQRWANGRGITHELSRWPIGTNDYDVRIAVAEIAESAPFSRFTGYTRWFAPAGPVTLHLPDGPHALTIGDAITFSGEDEARAEVTAKQWDLNLIVRTGLSFTARITGEPCDLAESGLAVAFVLRGTAIVGDEPLGPRDAFVGRGVVEPGPTALVAVMAIAV
jgi:environmental stress-induced protein Ves